MKLNYKKLGDYIRIVDERNKDNQVTRLLGVSIEKKFIESIANTIGTDMSIYKIVKKGQFAYGPVTSRNGDKVSIALLEEEECIISSSYSVFEIIDTNLLLPEYLNLWFKRPEFDRYARFHSHGSAREIFDWEEMCNVELPVPEISEQKKIVETYNTIECRIELKRQINDNLEEQIKTIFIEKIIHNSDFDKWEMRSIAQLANIVDNRGKTPPHYKTETDFPLIEIGAIHSSGRVIDYDYVEKYVSEECYNTCFRSGHPHNFDTLMSTVGSLAELKLFIGDKGSIAQNLVAFHCLDSKYALYLYQYLLFKRNDLLSYEIGSVQASIKVSQVIHYSIKIPTDSLIDKFNAVAKPLSMKIYQNSVEILSLQKMKKVILSALSR